MREQESPEESLLRLWDAEFPSPEGLHSRGAPAVRQLNDRITHSPVSSFETGQPRRKMLCPHNIERAVFRRG